MRLPNSLEWKQRKARLTGESTYGLLCKAYQNGLFHYNNGSRSSDGVKSFLEYFMGTISTDGYTVYRVFDGEDLKVFHIGCWTHCRRLWVDALSSDRTAMDIIDPR